METFIAFFIAEVAPRLSDLALAPAHLLGPIVLLGMLATEQRRVRPAAFARELNISVRKLRELLTLGAPVTRIQGLVFINPESFYRWLDRHERPGRSGIKGLRGVSASKVANVKSSAETPAKKEAVAAE